MSSARQQRTTYEEGYAEGLIEGFVLGLQQGTRDAAFETQRLMALLGITPEQQKTAMMKLAAERNVGRGASCATKASASGNSPLHA